MNLEPRISVQRGNHYLYVGLSIQASVLDEVRHQSPQRVSITSQSDRLDGRRQLHLREPGRRAADLGRHQIIKVKIANIRRTVSTLPVRQQHRLLQAATATRVRHQRQNVHWQ